VRVHEDIDKGYAWWILLSVFMNHVIVDGLMFSFGIFKIEFEDYFQKGAGQTSLVGSILSATALMTGDLLLVNRNMLFLLHMTTSVIIIIIIMRVIYIASKNVKQTHRRSHCRSAKRMTSILRHVV